MLEIENISNKLKLGQDGIWRASGIEAVSFPEDGYNSCFAIEDKSFWFKHRNDCIVSTIEAIPPKYGEYIFDIGGGNGFVGYKLQNSGFNVAVVEPGEQGAINAKRRGLKNVICASTNTADFKAQSIGAISLFDVLEHIEDDLEFLKSIQRILKKNGLLYITVPAYKSLWSQDDVDAGHFRRYNRKEIIALVESAGFKVEYATYFFYFLPIPIFIFRRIAFVFGLSSKKNKNKKNEDDHNPRNRLIGKFINFLLTIEIKLIKSRYSIPFGGSSLIIARRL